MDYVKAFLIGGAFCLIGQVLIDRTKLTPARILVCYVVFGVILSAVGFYEPIFEAVGCGISLPLVGFGGAVASGVREAVDKDGLWGVIKGPFTAMSAGVNFALILGFLSSLFFKGKSKRL